MGRKQHDWRIARSRFAPAQALWARLGRDLKLRRSDDHVIRAETTPRTGYDRSFELLWVKAAQLGFETDLDAGSARTVKERLLLTLDGELNGIAPDDLAEDLDSLDGVDWYALSEAASPPRSCALSVAELLGDAAALEGVKEALGAGQGHDCFYCGDDIKPGFQVDHFVPWSFCERNDLWNLVAACFSCNKRKRALLPPERYLEPLQARNERLIAEPAFETEWDGLSGDDVSRLLTELYADARESGMSVWGGTEG